MTKQRLVLLCAGLLLLGGCGSSPGPGVQTPDGGEDAIHTLDDGADSLGTDVSAHDAVDTSDVPFVPDDGADSLGTDVSAHDAVDTSDVPSVPDDGYVSSDVPVDPGPARFVPVFGAASASGDTRALLWLGPGFVTFQVTE